MYMKPNNTGKKVRLRTQTASQKLKQNAQIQGADGTQAFSVLYMTPEITLYTD